MRTRLVLGGMAVCLIAVAAASIMLMHDEKPATVRRSEVPVVQDVQMVVPMRKQVAATTTEVAVMFVGDLMFDRGVAQRVRTSRDRMYPFRKMMSPEGSFATGKELLVGNLEGPMTKSRRKPEKENDFAFDPSLAAALRDAGFTAVSQANNHALDQGRAGAAESRQALIAAGVLPFGDQNTEDPASAITVIGSGSQRVAMVGINAVEHQPDLMMIAQSLTQAELRASSTIVMLHWGEEYREQPTAEQRRLARWLIDRGAAAVFGAHPHWVQPIEVYRGKLIAYSLGNFIFDQDWSAETNRGLAVRWTPSGATLVPIGIEKSQPRVLTGGDRAQRLKNLAEMSDGALAVQIVNGAVALQP